MPVSRQTVKLMIRHQIESRIPRINDWCLECQELCSNLWMRGISGPPEDVSCILNLPLRPTQKSTSILWHPEDSLLRLYGRWWLCMDAVVIPFSIYGHKFHYFSIQLSTQHSTYTTDHHPSQQPFLICPCVCPWFNVLLPARISASHPQSTHFTRLANYSLDHKFCGWRIAAKCSTTTAEGAGLETFIRPPPPPCFLVGSWLVFRLLLVYIKTKTTRAIHQAGSGMGPVKQQQGRAEE